MFFVTIYQNNTLALILHYVTIDQFGFKNVASAILGGFQGHDKR